MDDRQLIADLLSALEYHTEQTRPIEFSKVAIEAAREYLRNPPQREWVELTDEEVAYFSYVLDHWTTTHIRGIEALLKAKNERL